MQPELLETLKNTTKSGFFSRDELEQRNQVLVVENLRLVRENYELRNQQLTVDQLLLVAREQLESQRHEQFGPSSERKSSNRPTLTDRADRMSGFCG